MRVRIVGWIFITVAMLVVVLGAWMVVSYFDTYDYNGLGDLVSQGWWVVVAAALPALTGWLLIARNPKATSERT